MADATTQVGRLDLGPDHLDGHGDPMLCRQGSAGSIPIG